MNKSFDQLRKQVNDTIYENAEGLVTAQALNQDLIDMLDSIEAQKLSDADGSIALDNKVYARQNGRWLDITGGTSGTSWGLINGTLDDQLDLKEALDAKASATSLSTEVADRIAGDAALRTDVDEKVVDVMIDGVSFLRGDKVASLPTASASQKGVMADAASDDKEYARKNGAWVEVTGGSGEVADVYVDGVSVLGTDKIARIPAATPADKGVMIDVPAALPGQVDPIEYVRKRNANGTVEWSVNSGGASGVTDVKIDGSSIVTDNVANIPTASAVAKGIMADVPATAGQYIRKRNADNTSSWEVAPIPVVDTAMSDTSENAVQNKVIKAYADTKVKNVRNADGTTIVVDGVADIPVASASTHGVLKVQGGIPIYRTKNATSMYDGTLYVANASATQPGVVTIGANIELSNQAQATISVPEATDAKKGVILDAPAAMPGAVDPVEYVRKRNADGTIEWAINSGGASGVVDVKIDGVSVVDAASHTALLHSASSTLKGVMNDIPAQDPSTATADKPFVRVAKADGSIAWEEGTGTAGVTSVRVSPSGTPMTGAVTIPVATSTTNGVCKIANAITSTGLDPVPAIRIYEGLDVKLEGVKIEGTALAMTDHKVEIPYASTTGAGVVRTATAGNSPKAIVSAGTQGVLQVDTASKTDFGVVKVGDNINITANGVISVPSATTDDMGVINDAPANGLQYVRKDGIWVVNDARTMVKDVLLDGVSLKDASNNVALPIGSTSEMGVVQLNNAIVAGETTKAVTGKAVNDKLAGYAKISSDTPLFNNVAIWEDNTTVKGAQLITSSTLSGASHSNLATTQAIKVYVDNSIAEKLGNLIWKGVVHSNDELTALGTPADKWSVIIGTAGTYASIVCTPGDFLIYNGDTSAWQHVHGSGSVVVTDNDATASGSRQTIATIQGVDIHYTVPSASQSQAGIAKLASISMSTASDAAPTCSSIRDRYDWKTASTLPSALLNHYFYNLGSVSSIGAFTLPSDVLDECVIQFTATADFEWPTLSVKYAGGEEPVIEAGKTYRMAFSNGCCVWNYFA